MKKFSLIIHPLFIVFSSILVYLGHFILLLSYLITIILHEFAHAYVARKLGYKLNQISLMPHGASLSGESKFFSTRDEIFIAAAGPALNIILAIVGCAVWWLWPMTYGYTLAFVYANLCTAIINCLPVFPLDGGRIALALLSKKVRRPLALKRIRIVGIIVSGVIIALFLLSLFFVPNFTLLVFGGFLMLTSILKDKEAYYTHMGIMESKSNFVTRGLKLRSLAVPEDMPLYKLVSAVTPDSLTEFSVIDDEFKVVGKINERDLPKLIEIYPANTVLKLIIT